MTDHDALGAIAEDVATPEIVMLTHRRTCWMLTCLTCDGPWPCAPFRRALPLETPAQRAAAVVRMVDEARTIRREGHRNTSPELMARLLWWLKLTRADATMFAGEVWPHDPLAPRS